MKQLKKSMKGHKTNLIEFTNSFGEILRGIEVVPDNPFNLGVVMLGGFERSATTEPQFKKFSDSLAKKGLISLRLDYTGLGLSDGDFIKTSNKSMQQDLELAVLTLKNRHNITKVSVVGHSNSAGVIAISRLLPEFDRIVLLAPALNKYCLHRYWFSQKTNKNIEITWDNYEDYFDEQEFEKMLQKDPKQTKYNQIHKEYHLEDSRLDYSKELEPYNYKILCIQAEFDSVVPISSQTMEFNNQIVAPGAKHSLNRYVDLLYWLPKAVDFVVSESLLRLK